MEDNIFMILKVIATTVAALGRGAERRCMAAESLGAAQADVIQIWSMMNESSSVVRGSPAHLACGLDIGEMIERTVAKVAEENRDIVRQTLKDSVVLREHAVVLELEERAICGYVSEIDAVKSLSCTVRQHILNQYGVNLDDQYQEIMMAYSMGFEDDEVDAEVADTVLADRVARLFLHGQGEERK